MANSGLKASMFDRYLLYLNAVIGLLNARGTKSLPRRGCRATRSPRSTPTRALLGCTGKFSLE
jgi:hypothetical protein